MAWITMADVTLTAFLPTLTLTAYYFWPGVRLGMTMAPLRVLGLVVPGVCYAVSTVTDFLSGQWGYLVIHGAGAAVYGWLWWKSGGGDSTKKKLKKAKEAIAVTGARLTVVPGSGFDLHRDTPTPESIDFSLDAVADGWLLLTCPSCGAQIELQGQQLLGKVSFLIGDHRRTHEDTVATWQRRARNG